MKQTVTTTRTFGHWIRRRFLPESLAVTLRDSDSANSTWLSREDTYLFLLSFGAFFTMIMTFIL